MYNRLVTTIIAAAITALTGTGCATTSTPFKESIEEGFSPSVRSTVDYLSETESCARHEIGKTAALIPRTLIIYGPFSSENGSLSRSSGRWIEMFLQNLAPENVFTSETLNHEFGLGGGLSPSPQPLTAEMYEEMRSQFGVDEIRLLAGDYYVDTRVGRAERGGSAEGTDNKSAVFSTDGGLSREYDAVNFNIRMSVFLPNGSNVVRDRFDVMAERVIKSRNFSIGVGFGESITISTGGAFRKVNTAPLITGVQKNMMRYAALQIATRLFPEVDFHRCLVQIHDDKRLLTNPVRSQKRYQELKDLSPEQQWEALADYLIEKNLLRREQQKPLRKEDVLVAVKRYEFLVNRPYSLSVEDAMGTLLELEAYRRDYKQSLRKYRTVMNSRPAYYQRAGEKGADLHLDLQRWRQPEIRTRVRSVSGEVIFESVRQLAPQPQRYRMQWQKDESESQWESAEIILFDGPVHIRTWRLTRSTMEDKTT